MTTNRSSEELAMRDAVEAWGRARWPSARVVHELVTGECRIDMAFVTPDHLIGVEIKSSRDVLTRLEDQIAAFHRMLPEVWLAIAPKWAEHDDVDACWSTGQVLVSDGVVNPNISSGAGRAFRRDARPVVRLTAPMLDLLWRNELHAIAARKRVWSAKGKPARGPLIDALSRKLTGDEIVAEVCRELRGRDAFWKADPPVVLPGLAATDMPGRLDLFRSGTPADPLDIGAAG